eukprot:6193120-Pleurochrysis_carterae.AAC.1
MCVELLMFGRAVCSQVGWGEVTPDVRSGDTGWLSESALSIPHYRPSSGGCIGSPTLTRPVGGRAARIMVTGWGDRRRGP